MVHNNQQAAFCHAMQNTQAGLLSVAHHAQLSEQTPAFQCILVPKLGHVQIMQMAMPHSRAKVVLQKQAEVNCMQGSDQMTVQLQKQAG